MSDGQTPSKSALDRPGRNLAEAWSDGRLDETKDSEDFRLFADYRRSYVPHLLRVRARLERIAKDNYPSAVVGQRHKREDRIIRKLARGSTRLTQLQDIGGCRAVLDRTDDAETVADQLTSHSKHSASRVDRYIEESQGHGYRAIHVIVTEQGFQIEAQIRTRGQQLWADAVEAIDSARALGLKDGDAPCDITRYFELASELIYCREYDKDPGSQLVRSFEAARQEVVAAGYYSG